ETLAQQRIAGKVRGKNLDGDGALESRVARSVDLSHAAGTERSLDLVRAEFGSRREGHCVPRIIEQPGSSSRSGVGSRLVSVPPVATPAHQGAQVHPQLLDRGTTDVPPSVVDPVDLAAAVEHERVGDRNARMSAVARIHDVEGLDDLPLVIAQEREGRSQL